MPQLHKSRIAGQDGQTTVEYAVVLLFVAIVLLLALAVGFDGLLDNVPAKIVSALP